MEQQLGQCVLRFKCNNCGTLFTSSRSETLWTHKEGIAQMMKRLPEFWWFHSCGDDTYGTADAVGIIVQK